MWLSQASRRACRGSAPCSHTLVLLFNDHVTLGFILYTPIYSNITVYYDYMHYMYQMRRNVALTYIGNVEDFTHVPLSSAAIAGCNDGIDWPNG